jgi:Dolichyl-phosphate-mannose-protein mannosyltransferase
MNILAWAWGFVCLVTASVCLWPWVNRWLALPVDEWRLMRWPLTVGLSLGFLTLWMTVIGFWQLNTLLVLAFPIIMLAGSLLVARPQFQLPSRLSITSIVKNFFAKLLRADLAAWIVLALLGMLLLVLAQAAYFPFIGDDEISRYAYYAKLVFTKGRVTEAVRGYPMFLPMAFAFVFFASGQVAEQLARLVPVILSISTVVATGALAWRWLGKRAAWGAAFVLAASPLYLRWSPDGYIDIPSALFFILCAYAGDVWLHTRTTRWAALAGVLAGLAMWTKQAGFAALGCLGLVFAWAIVLDVLNKSQPGRSPVKAFANGALALGMALMAGGLWYVRNAYYDGWSNAVPGPGPFYYQLANHSPLFLVPFIGMFRDFGVLVSPLFIVGLVWALVRFRCTAWALVWAVPYTLLWWRLFSYDARFMLTVLPFFAIATGGLLTEVRWQVTDLARWGGVVAILAIALTGMVNSGLGGWWQWLVAPTATYAQRLERAKGPLYPTAEYVLTNLPPDAKLISMDGRLSYYLMDRDMFVTYPQTLSEVRRYDYFIVGSWTESVYAAGNEVVRALEDPKILEPLYWGPSGGLVVYRVVKP